jgi:hypothetical protein
MANNDYITTDCKLTVSKNTAKLDEEIFLYKNDRNIKLLIEIVDNKYRYKSDDLSNLLVKYKASYAQVKWYKNAEVKKEFPIQATDDGKVVFVIEGQLIDEDTELGDYDLQLRLLNESQESIRSLPIIKGAVHILKPLFEEGDIATVNSAVADVSMLSLDGDAIDTYNSDGTYNQTNWGNGDVISSAKLNKLEKVAKDNVDKVNKMPAKSIVEGGKIYLAKEDGTKLDSGTELPAGGTGTSYDDTEIKSDINTIKTDLGTEELTTTAKDVKGAVNEVAAQYKDIAKKVENAGQPTQEQINTAIDKAIEDGKLTGTGGINSTAKTLLQTILQNAVYTTNQSANITALISALGNNEGGGGDTPTVKTYTITNNLTHCSNSNTSTSVNENSNYAATITPAEGYTLTDASVSITMGGVDITSTAYNNGSINIASVTGNIVITITATSSSSSSEMVTDGLVNYFDFRNVKYDNKGAGKSTIIGATQGNGSLFTWINDAVTKQDNYGIEITRTLSYNPNSVGTTSVSLGTSFTAIFKCYLTNTSSPLFFNEYAAVSNVSKLNYKPKYKTTSSTANLAITSLGSRLDSGYDTVTLIVDGNISKLYFGTTLVQTNDGSTINDFQGWYDQLNGIGVLGGNNNGYLTQMAVYNKALSEVQLVDMIDYLKTLEVNK